MVANVFVYVVNALSTNPEVNDAERRNVYSKNILISSFKSIVHVHIIIIIAYNHLTSLTRCIEVSHVVLDIKLSFKYNILVSMNTNNLDIIRIRLSSIRLSV